ncbi:MAG TPA: hypothetical protein VEL76_02510, partial [Gemmataceae bacterium]|nr:hypothetical protein [Gemmataceae bacterium]
NQAQMGVTLRLTDMPLARAVSLLAAAVDLKAVPVGKALIVTTEKGAVALQIEGLQEKNAELLKATPGGQPTFTLPGVCLNSAFLGLPAPPPQDPGPAPCCGEESSRAVAPEGDKGGPGKKAGGPKEGPAPKPSRGIQILQKLAEPMDVMEEALTAQHTLREALRFLNERPDWPAPVTVDDTVFRAENPDAPDIYDTPVKLPRLKGVPRERVLRMLLNQIATQNATFLVRNGDILVTTNEAATAERQPVQAIFSKRSLDEALQELAEQTGISVVLDARAAEKGRTLVTATFRPGTILLNAVRLLADMADLKAVVVDNLVYVTLRSNSTEFPPLGPLGKRREAVLE